MIEFYDYFSPFAQLIGEYELKDILLCMKIDLMQEGIDEPHICDKEIDELNLGDFRFDIDDIIEVYFPHYPFFVEST